MNICLRNFRLAIIMLCTPLFIGNVVAQSLVLASPNGLQRWETASQRRILFSTSGVDSVRIQFSPDNGASWSNVVSSTPASTGSYTWSIPTAQTDLGLIRILNAANAGLNDVSDQPFSIVPRRSAAYDFVLYNDNANSEFCETSRGQVTAPSSLALVAGKVPVSSAFSLVGNFALKLDWNSASGGSWEIAVSNPARSAIDIGKKDSLVFNILSSSFMFPGGFPAVFLEDSSAGKTLSLPLRNFVGAVGAGLWQRCAIPLKAFRNNSGQANLQRISSVGFAQDQADNAQHTWYIDDIRMTSVRQFSDSAKVIVILGSSTAAGTGASPADSAWVPRYKRYIAGIDTTAQIINLAIGGYTTYDVMPTEYVPPAGRPAPKPLNNITMGLAYRPQAIVVNLPSNDVAYGYSVAEAMANYDTLWERARTAGVPIWICTAQPRNIVDPLVRDRLRQTSESTFVHFGSRTIDVWNGLAASDGTILPQYNAGDGIHLNNAGHRLINERVIAANIWNTITSVFAFSHWRIPERPELAQNYPNPFNPSTKIEYALGARSHVDIRIHDILGREVASLINEEKVPGRHFVVWNASGYASGVYLYTLKAGEFTETKRMILVR